MSRIGVLHFTSNGNSGYYFTALARNHDRERFRVVIGTLSSAGPMNERLEREGVETFALDCHARSGFAGAALRLARWLRRENIAVVQTHLYEASLVGLTAARLANVPVRILTTHHTNDSFLHYERLGKRLAFRVDTFAARFLANHVIAVSSHVRRTLEEHEGVPSSRISEIQYGFDFGGWAASGGARDRLRAEWRFTGCLIFGTVGRLNWVKDYAGLIRAFAEVRSQRADARLVIVGEGSLRGELGALAESLGVAADVAFVGFRSDIPDVLSAFDVFVGSSLTEACNQAIVEALASDRLVVATRVGAAPDHVVEGHTGVLVEPDDVRSLATGMLTAAQMAPSQSPGAFLRMARTMSAREMVRSYEAVYRRLLGRLDLGSVTAA